MATALPEDPSITIKVGEKLFEGAQASIYRYAGSTENGIDANIMIDEMMSLQPHEQQHPTTTTSGSSGGGRGGGGLCVKVMGSKDRAPGSLAARLVADDQLVDQAEFLATFHAARESTEITHPNMIPYLLVETDSSQTCLMMVMPLFAGDLLKWVAGRGKKVSEESLLHIAEQLCSAIEHLHSKNVWHLDLSLRNVLVSSLGDDMPRVMLIDTESSTLGGRGPSQHFTYEWSAPERGDRPSAKCDVFSMGMILFAAGARHDCPGLVENVPGLGTVTMNYQQLTPTRIAAVVRRDLDHCESLVSLVTMMMNHDATTRPSMTFVLENIRALKATRSNTGVRSLLSFPYVCGPFDLHAFSTETTRRCDLHTKSGMYDLHLSCPHCGLQRSTDSKRRSDCPKTDMIHLPGHTSPFCANFVPPTAEKQVDSIRGMASRSAGVSESAKRENGPTGSFFLYPMVTNLEPQGNSTSGMSQPQGGVAAASAAILSYGTGGLSTPEAMIQSQGGFAFTTYPPDHETRTSTGDASEKQPLNPPFTVLSFCPRGVQPQGYQVAHPAVPLYFTAAQPWPSECTIELSRAGRIHQEVPAMLGQHAKAFCWILPHEEFTLKNGEKWTPAEDGGFVFWFGNDPLTANEMDRYFAVAPSAAHMETRIRESRRRRDGSNGNNNQQEPKSPGVGAKIVATSNKVLSSVGQVLSTAIHTVTRPSAEQTSGRGGNGSFGNRPTPITPTANSSSSSSTAPTNVVKPGDNIAIYFKMVPVSSNFSVQVAPEFKPPVSWKFPLTGEFGQCSEATYLSTAKASAIGAPRDAKYICFARVDDASLRSRQRRRADGAEETTTAEAPTIEEVVNPPQPRDYTSSVRFMPQHGFLLLNMRYEVVGVISLRITTSFSVSEELKRHATKMELLGLPSDNDYQCQLPPAELVEVEARMSSTATASDSGSFESPLPPGSSSSGPTTTTTSTTNETSSSSPTSPWSLVLTGGLGFVGWSSKNNSFYFSDEMKSAWLVRQWSSIK